MEKIKDLAIVLRSVQYEDRHRIVTALTLDGGLVSALARNSIYSRRFGGSLDLFVASDWVFSSRPGAELVQLLEAEVRESFDPIRKDLIKVALASVLTEVALRVVPPREPCPEFFRLYSNALVGVVELNSGAGQVLAFLNAYLVKVLHWTGNQPGLRCCLSCGAGLDEQGQGAKVWGELSSASWICQKCVQAGGDVLSGRSLWCPESQTSGGRKDFGSGLSPAGIQDLGRFMQLPIRECLRELQGGASEHHLLLFFIQDLLAYHLPGFGTERVKSVGYLLGLVDV